MMKQFTVCATGLCATRLPRAFCLALVMIVVSGCGLSTPNWFQPGHLYHQRLRATHFDPYADVDSAPGFDGSRPRDYQRPRSQSEKAQWFMDIPQQ